MKNKHEKHFKHRSCGSYRGSRGPGFGGILIKSLLVMLLWNALIPGLFGGPAIGFFQSLGLTILGHLISGGFRSWRFRHHEGKRHLWKMKMRQDWENMSEEEKVRFRDSFRKGPVEVNVFEVEEDLKEDIPITDESEEEEQE